MADQVLHASPLRGEMERPPIAEGRAGTPELPRITNVHIAKSAGSSVDQWAYQRHLTFNPHPVRRCNTTLGRNSTNHGPFGAPTTQHCVNIYTPHENQTGFCILRNPLDRLVSEVNMKKTPGCDVRSLNKLLVTIIKNGHVDNHDVTQVEYASFCDFFLCFNALQSNWEQFISRAHILRQPGGKNRLGFPRAVIERPDARNDPRFLPRSPVVNTEAGLSDYNALANVSYLRLTYQRRGGQGTCHSSNVSSLVAAMVKEFYHLDYLLYSRTCIDVDARLVPFWSRPTAVGQPTRGFARELLASATQRLAFGDTNRWPEYDALLSQAVAAMPTRGGTRL